MTERPESTPVLVPLTQLRRGQRAVIAGLAGDVADGPLVEAMGIRRDCELRVCRTGSSCIVALETPCGGGCRVGLSREIADRVLVKPEA
ncbi:MAG: FeoA family protein [Planctomycetota bacterium]